MESIIAGPEAPACRLHFALKQGLKPLIWSGAASSDSSILAPLGRKITDGN
jgi:hypothetical protein